MIMKETSLKWWKDSYGIQLDQEILAEVGAEADTIFEMVVDDGQIVLTPIGKNPVTLEELFKEYDGECLSSADKYWWDDPQGAEML